VIETREVAAVGPILSDHIGYLPKRQARSRKNPFHKPAREIRVKIETGKILRILTNDLHATAQEIADLYKRRWAIELFFRWVKQNLKIRKFLGTSENAVRIQLTVALIAFLLLKLVVGYWHLETSGDLGKAAFNSIYVLALSLVVGAAFGFVSPWLNRLATSSQSTTVTFAMLVLLMTGVAQTLHVSPLLAALAFGAVARERRIILSPAQRNFGGLGDLLTVFLFVFIGSLLSWNGLLGGLLLGVSVLLVRSASHTLVNVSVARASGTTFRKGALTGLALMPMSAFAMLLLEESRLYGFDLARDSLPMIVGLLVLLEVIAPVVTQRALIAAGEARPNGN